MANKVCDAHIKKRLIFYFYTFNGFLDNRAIQIHLRCLSHYCNVFDEALFIISIDDIEDDKLIFDTETEILKCGFRNIQFKVHKNNSYCESQPFFEEIVSKLDVLDGLTFFGHTKGITNVLKNDVVIESIDAWILGMYYLNLEFIDEVEKSLCYTPHRFYGAFLTDCKDPWYKQFFYAGTFYWINCPYVWNDAVAKIVKLPTTFNHRNFAESFPGLLYEWNNGRHGLDSHCKRILYLNDFYKKSHTSIPFLTGCEDGYNKFKEAILNKI